MNISQNLIRGAARQLSTSAAVRSSATKGNIPQGYFQLKKVQERFQVNDGKPIFLKGGATDNILYRITMGLCLVGMGGILKLFYELSNPKIE